jgi:rSAM/selenodomain-associated transferase 2
MMRFTILAAGYALIMIRMAGSGPVGSTGGEICLLYIVAFACLMGMVRYFPIHWNERQTLCFVFTVAVGCRLLFLWFPVSYDVHRYVWEGYIQHHGVNPYLEAPDSIALRPFITDDLAFIWEHINHKDLSAGYPPLSLLCFRLLAMLSLSPFFFKACLVALDLLVLIPLAIIFRHKKIPFVRLLWYAANPLVLLFIAGEGHLDSLMVCLLCSGLALVIMTPWAGVGFFLIGCAGMAKYFAFGVLPFLVHKNNWQRLWLAVVPLLFFLPYADAGKSLFASIGTFATQFHYNDSVTVLLRWMMGQGALSAVILLLALGWMCIFWVEHDRLRSTGLAMGLLLICLPTLHPWYLLLIAPFAAAYASPPWLLLQVTVVFTFPVLIHEYQTGVFQEIHWLKWFEYLPFYLLLGWFGWKYSGARKEPFNPVHSLSVVIPSLNEADVIAGCISSIQSQPGRTQLIVADGGSTDDTLKIAGQCGAEVVHARKGRGYQIAEGIKQSDGDVILIVHADSRLSPNTTKYVMHALNRHPYIAGGAMGMGFQPDSPKKRWIASLNNWRSRWTGIAFGDQGQFFRAKALASAGGFPQQMLMEDVELALRMKTIGLTVFLKRSLMVSGRRWDATVFQKNIGTVLRLFGTYLWERRWGVLTVSAEKYYWRYYS